MGNKSIKKVIIKVIAATIIFLAVSMRLLSAKYWIGDYRIFINTDSILKTATLCGYRGDEVMEIPSKVGPFKISSLIEDDIFKNNKNITSIYISSDFDPEIIINIESCENLKKIEYEKGTTVTYLVVYSCSNLEEVVFPEGVEEIKGDFARCYALRDISFPDSLKCARQVDFEGTKFYELHENDKYYVVGDGVLLFFNGDRNEDIVIPAGVKFYDGILRPENETISRNVYIPDSIESLIVQVYDGDTYYFGNGEIDNLKLDKSGSHEGVNGTIVAPANSYVEQYCKEKGYNFRAMTEEEEKEWREKTEEAASEITYQE